MGLFSKINKWIQKKGLIGLAAKNATIQFNKLKAKEPNLSEKEISTYLFQIRYTNPKGVFSNKEYHKISSYMNKEFYPENLIEFCLISLDIEGGLDFLDKETYIQVSEILKEVLDDLGYFEEITNNDMDYINDGFKNPKAIYFHSKWLEYEMDLVK